MPWTLLSLLIRYVECAVMSFQACQHIIQNYINLTTETNMNRSIQPSRPLYPPRVPTNTQQHLKSLLATNAIATIAVNLKKYNIYNLNRVMWVVACLSTILITRLPMTMFVE